MTSPHLRRHLRPLLAILLLLGGLFTAVAAAQELPDGVARIHYQRPDGAYDGFELHVWEDTTDSVTWADGLDISGFDDYGAYWDVNLAENAERVGFIVHKGDLKDPGPDMFLVLSRHGREIWLQSGSDEIFTSRPLEPPAEGIARIHYFRPDDDYDGFTLHVWEDTSDSVTWEAGLEPAGRTDFGIYWEVHLQPDAERIGFIVHRGDEKDPGPDMFLELAEMGREVWLISGSTRIYSERPDIRLAGSGDLGAARAYWVAPELILWPTGVVVPGTEFTLHAAADAGLELSEAGVTGGSAVALALDEAGVPAEVLERFPHLAGASALRLPDAALADVPELLRGQVAVSMTRDGSLVDATGLQVPGVLDALYADAARPLAFGPSWRGGAPTLRLWAPTAQEVWLHLFADGDTPTGERLAMTRDDASGSWSISGTPDWRGRYYLFEVTVFAPSTGKIETNLVTDPYSLSLARDSRRSQLIDLFDVTDAALTPPGWAELRKRGPAAPEDAVIYELHLRDFSAMDESVPAEHRGTYLAFTHPGSNGMRHLRALADAGLTHLHLLPTFDIATIHEDPADRTEPVIPPITPPSASPEPQAAIEAVKDQDAYNWGYDPYHYNVPEGSYATRADGTTRIREYRQMVLGLADAGLRLVADVVYNHTNAAGQSEKSVLDRVVPGYYHRLDANGRVTTSTCCQNTATEHAMMEKLMVDSVVLWAKAYKVDGFRFDLMGHHMVRNMAAVRAALDALTLERDGVDGHSILLYGEGWNFGEVANNARGVNATQLNLAGSGIATFNDRLRDAVRGGGPFDSGDALIANQGFASGLYSLPNPLAPPPEIARRNLLLATDQIRVGLAGNLRDFTFVSRDGVTVRGAEVPYHDAPAGYTLDPQEQVAYVSNHDNQTLYDIVQYKLPLELPSAQRARLQQVALSTVALAQGVPFFHAGSDLLRSKSFDRDSFNSGDWFNRLDFTYQRNNFGVGLPPAGVNRNNWRLMRERLTRENLLPSPDEIAWSAEVFREWLRIRAGSPLFRLRTADEVQARLTFRNTGPDQAPGVIVMQLSDMVAGADLDPALELIVVVFNPTPKRQTLRYDDLAGLDLRLHPEQRRGVDEQVQASAFYSASGQLSVPALSTAVFVLPEGGW